MSIKLPDLPFYLNAIEPNISKKTLELHYAKHHAGYVFELNKQIVGTIFEKMELDDIVLDSFHDHPDIFNNAGQVWNHNYMWNCLTPVKSSPSIYLEALLSNFFGSLENFKKNFLNMSSEIFGSGWIWLVKDLEGRLSLKFLPGAETPINNSDLPLLTCDVWEHAYYLDYQNDRAKYLSNYWDLIDWAFVESKLNNHICLNLSFELSI
jgi:superoxide dismutase, Fe-Mn family